MKTSTSKRLVGRRKSTCTCSRAARTLTTSSPLAAATQSLSLWVSRAASEEAAYLALCPGIQIHTLGALLDRGLLRYAHVSATLHAVHLHAVVHLSPAALLPSGPPC